MWPINQPSYGIDSILPHREASNGHSLLEEKKKKKKTFPTTITVIKLKIQELLT